MTIVACWHEAPDVRATLRRAIPRNSDAPRVRTCRSRRGLHQLFDTAVIDAVILDARRPDPDLLALASEYVAVPFFGYGRLRADDGAAVRQCQAAGFQGVIVEGADDPVVWRLIAQHTSSARRRRALADAPRRLRILEVVQLAAWQCALRRETEPTTTQDIADTLGLTREHLSREFAAGGAPNLKRVIDLVRIACAADLLRCRAYSVPLVARLLRWPSPAQLSATARRVAGVPAAGLPGLGVRGVLSRFVAGRTRSRL